MAKRKRLLPARTRPAEAEAPAPAAPPIAQVAGAASGAAAAQEMADYLAQARAGGLLLSTIRLDRIETGHLQRDRLPVDEADEEMQALIQSIRARGQQAPIEVVRLVGDPRERYGLVSGMRRVTALRHLWRETGEARFAQVVARVLTSGGPEAYLAMVEENEIRADLSFWERARIVVKAVEAGAFPDRAAALKGLYGNVSRAKRSKIGSFVPVVEALDGRLRFPTALSEKRGLALSAALGEPEGRERVMAALEGADPESAEAEQALLSAAVAPARREKAPEKPPAAVEVTAVDGTLVLSGPGVDAALDRALRAWLAARGR